MTDFLCAWQDGMHMIMNGCHAVHIPQTLSGNNNDCQITLPEGSMVQGLGLKFEDQRTCHVTLTSTTCHPLPPGGTGTFRGGPRSCGLLLSLSRSEGFSGFIWRAILEKCAYLQAVRYSTGIADKVTTSVLAIEPRALEGSHWA